MPEIDVVGNLAVRLTIPHDGLPSARRAKGQHPCTDHHARTTSVDHDDVPVPCLPLTSLAAGRWLPRCKWIGSISSGQCCTGADLNFEAQVILNQGRHAAFERW